MTATSVNYLFSAWKQAQKDGGSAKKSKNIIAFLALLNRSLPYRSKYQHKYIIFAMYWVQNIWKL